MNIFTWLNNALGLSSCVPQKNIPKLDNSLENLHNLQSDIQNIVSAICVEYRNVAYDIELAKSDEIPISELQINLGERQSLSKILGLFQYLDITKFIIEETMNDVKNFGFDVKNIDDSQITRNDIRMFLSAQISYQKDINIVLEEGDEHLYLVDWFGFDSLDLVELLMATEEQYNVEISNEASLSVKTIKDAVDLIIIATSIQD
jgi:acyl carrier protein